MSKSQTIKVFLTNIIVLSCLLGQDVSYPPPTTLVTMPTAGTLVRGSFSLEMRVQKGGGMSTALQVGITDRFQFGSSFGASNLIGDDSLRWYPRPEVNLKYRLIDETMSIIILKEFIFCYGTNRNAECRRGVLPFVTACHIKCKSFKRHIIF